MPTIIMGETGVGKTAVISYLADLQTIFAEELFMTLNVHSGISEQRIIEYVSLA